MSADYSLSNNPSLQHRMALSDATNRANHSPVRCVGQKGINSPPMPSFAEFMTTADADRTTSQIRTHSGQSVVAPPVTASVPKTTTPGATGKKRKAETTLQEDIDAYKQDLDHIIDTDTFEDESLPSCNAVRRQINKLLDSGIMTKTEFIKAIKTNSNTLNRFLQASGPMGGSGSTIYYNAWAWFRQREVAKLKMPDVKKRQKREADAAAATTGAITGAGATSSGKAKKTGSLPDISGIHLAGEETDTVPVYDSCDEIRKKINAHLRTPGLTQAQFCRDLYAQLQAPRCKGIQSKQLADFRAMKGSNAGARSAVFYAAYVYFEKLRLAQDKPKTAHRETMEELWAGSGGFHRDRDHRTLYFTGRDEELYVDRYGMTQFINHRH